MLYAGLDLSRKRLDFHLLDSDGATVEVGAAPPDADGLRGLSERLARHGEAIRAAIESMNGARFRAHRRPTTGRRGESRATNEDSARRLGQERRSTDRAQARSAVSIELPRIGRDL